jgi:hypothetical protein
MLLNERVDVIIHIQKKSEYIKTIVHASFVKYWLHHNAILKELNIPAKKLWEIKRAG